MDKRFINFFTIIWAFPVIICIIVAGAYRFNLDRASWIALATTLATSISTLGLGIAVYIQTERHNERQEKSSCLFQEQETKNREQDLLIRANPTVFLDSIQRFDIGTAPCITGLQEGTKNILTDIKPTKDTQIFPYYFSFDLLFNNPANRLVDYITINSATLSCETGNIEEDDYHKIFSLNFYKYNHPCANIKLAPNGNSVALLQLFPSNFTDKDFNGIYESIENSKAKWYLTINYVLSNSFGVKIEFEAQILFNIEKYQESDFSIALTTKTNNIVVWQKSELYINEKTNR